MYKSQFREAKKEIPVIKYSEMEDKYIILGAIATLRGARLLRDGTTPEEKRKLVDEMRTALAQRQHDKIKNVLSFKELELCQKMMFR